jgi:hypothetical protein
MKSSLVHLGLLTLAVSVSGCAYFRAAGARADARREGIEKFTYAKACDALSAAQSEVARLYGRWQELEAKRG